MPGLIGIVSENVIDEQLLDRMVNSIKHEEFHRVDKYFSQHFACGRIHLGIFNPETQPIFNQDRSVCIFMDGKIYDYKDKLNELKKRGFKFNYENDPEFCLHSYEEYGKDFIKTLNGNFVLLIYDFKNRKAIIANDRFGLRIHYYAVNTGKLLLAPEAKAILQDETFKKELNDEAVAEFFAFGEFWEDKTFFKGIKVLTPASILTYDGRDVSIEKYWELKYEPDYNKSDDEFVNELVRTFKKAVDIRTRDNLRYGISLSGGLDSRNILAGIPSEKRKDVVAFTFGQKDCDEVKIAEKVAKKAKIKEHLLLDISPELIMNNAEKEIWLTDGRDHMGVSFAIPIFKSIKDKVDVIFDGFLLDTVVTSIFLTKDILNAKSHEYLSTILYNKVTKISDEELSELFVDEYYNRIKTYPLSTFKRVFDKINEHHPGNKSNLFRIQSHSAWTPIYYVLLRLFEEESIPAVDNDFIDVIRTIPPEKRLDRHIYRKFLMKLSPELAKIQYNHTMIRADAPLLFWRIGETYLNMKGIVKTILYQISGGRIFLPERRSYVDFYEWFRTNEQWQVFFREALLKENNKSEKFFNQNYIEKLLQEQISGEKNNSDKLKYIASFKIFLKLFF
jgi:asparagine synthase (glutamine-hydrolysing)